MWGIAQRTRSWAALARLAASVRAGQAARQSCVEFRGVLRRWEFLPTPTVTARASHPACAAAARTSGYGSKVRAPKSAFATDGLREPAGTASRSESKRVRPPKG